MALQGSWTLLAALAVMAAGRTTISTPHGRRASLSREASRFTPRVPGIDDVRTAMAEAVNPTRGRALGVPTSKLNLSSVVSVLDFGAVPDGTTDNTAAFNAALASLAPLGGVVFVPAGQWAFQGSIIMTKATSLVGTYETVPSHGLDGAPADGSVLMPMGGRGVEAGGACGEVVGSERAWNLQAPQPRGHVLLPPTRAAFINMTEDCTVRGFTIFYPDNIPDAAPAPYPWTIGMQGNNNAVQVGLGKSLPPRTQAAPHTLVPLSCSRKCSAGRRAAQLVERHLRRPFAAPLQ